MTEHPIREPLKAASDKALDAVEALSTMNIAKTVSPAVVRRRIDEVDELLRAARGELLSAKQKMTGGLRLIAAAEDGEDE